MVAVECKEEEQAARIKKSQVSQSEKKEYKSVKTAANNLLSCTKL